jgi:GDP-4-dehydro-6-deoxy-D-mannose reductase
MKTLVTGADGFIGRWLTKLLVERGDEVTGVSRRAIETGGAIQYLRADVRDEAALNDVVARTRPARVFHLAALNHIATSFEKPEETFAVNLLGTLHVLNAVRAFASEAVVVSVGSSAEYGESTQRVDRVREDDPLLPTSPYGISKVAQGLTCRQMHLSYGMRTVHVRPFAVVGPGKEGDAMSQFARQVAGIELGRQDKMRAGNLASERDFVDVRDCSRALVFLSERAAGGTTYNVCTGTGVTIGDLAEAFRRNARKSFEVVRDEAQLRKVDDTRIVGSPHKLAELGFSLSFSLDDTVRDTLSALRESMEKSS